MRNRIDNWLERRPTKVSRRWMTSLVLLIALSLVLPAAMAVAQQDEPIDITRLGTSNAFVRDGAQSREEVQRFMSENRAEIEALLRQVGWEGNPQDIFDAVENGDFDEAQYPIGTIFAWMAIRKGGVAQATPRIRWAGGDPFEAFEIRVASECANYRFLIPKACGNFSLISEQKIPPPNAPNIRVTQDSRCSGGTATIDVTVNGMVPDDRLELTLTAPDGSTRTLSPSSTGQGQFRAQVDQDQVGSYSVKATVIGACGRTEDTARFSTEACGPTCNLSVSGPGMDEQIKLNESFMTVDMSGSSAGLGNIESASATVTATGPDGTTRTLEALSFSAGNMTAQVPIDAYGTTYNFSGEVRDSRGLTTSCTAQYVSPVKPKRGIWPYFAPEIGLERRWRAGMNGASTLPPIKPGAPAQQASVQEEFVFDRSAVLVGGLGGVMFPVAEEKVALFAQFAGVFNTRDSENSTLYADFGLNYNFDSGVFLGAGAGIWDISHSDTRDGTFFVQGGTDVAQAGNFTVQWFIEGRLFFDMLDMIDNNYAAFTGIRFVLGKESRR